MKRTRHPSPRGDSAYEREVLQTVAELADVGLLHPSSVLSVQFADPTRALVVTTHVDGTHLVDELFNEREKPANPIAENLGQLLASVHALPMRLVANERDGPRYIPSMFDHVLPSVDALPELTGAQVGIVRTLQRFPALVSEVEALRLAWSSSAFIHGDLSASNILLPRDEFTPVIADWELAGAGDPAWDTGTVLAEWLSYWVSSMPITQGIELDRLAAMAGISYVDVITAFRTFWHAYVRTRSFNDDERSRLHSLTVRMCGVRLFQKAMEYGYRSHAPTGREQLLMQVGMNCLLTPEHVLREV